jgi:hypothetical protein
MHIIGPVVRDGREKLPLASPAGEELIARRKPSSCFLLYIDLIILFILSQPST